MLDLTGAAGNTGAASTLRTEVLGDGLSNCLEKAMNLAQPGDSIVLMNDSRDGVGHALVRKPDGSVVDPNHPSVRYETLGQWQALHPEYRNPVSVPAAQVRQVLSTPVGEQRDALLRQLGLSGVANRPVADSETTDGGERWATARNASVNVRGSASTDGELLTELPRGENMVVIGEATPEGDSHTWYNVRLPDGSEGWVRADVVNVFTPPPPPRFPEWMEKGTRPPQIDPQMWEAMPPASREAVIREQRERTVAASYPEPDWIRQGSNPPDMTPQQWQELPREEREAITRYGREQWRAAVRQQTDFLFNGVPEGGVRMDASFLGINGASQLGDGQVGQWNQYAVQLGNAAQYLNLERMFGTGEGWPKMHFNLCGPLAVGASLGLGPLEALTLFKDISTQSADKLKGQGTTTDTNLIRMYEAARWTATDSNQEMQPQELARYLANGQQLVALVNIDTEGANGMLRPLDDSTKKVAHWVNVRAVDQAANGEWVVRVYNPFHNREEVYSWSEFKEAWQQTQAKNDEGDYVNNNPYGLIVATPPQD